MAAGLAASQAAAMAARPATSFTVAEASFTEGPRSGTTYWVEKDEWGDPAYLKIVRAGKNLRLYGWLPEAVRLHDWAVSCGKARIKQDGISVVGYRETYGRDLSRPGWKQFEQETIGGRVWLDGGILRNDELSSFYGYGSENRMQVLTPSTIAASGGGNWKRITSECDKRLR